MPMLPWALAMDASHEVVHFLINLLELWRQLVMLYSFDFHEQRAACARSEKVRDIKGQGFHEKLSGLADSVFLDLPQSWLAVPSAAKMLKEDRVLCSFSPCIEQVQRTCEVLRSDFIEIRTFEVLLRT
ncbi:BnaC03g27150D [Brassica napus]|uniref:tRNA (adenine(58)-N(1))-methyltransferase n=1 Tax=Brassica napus TaxID=3708 RepID=A0A078G8Y2_BRANA|nr:BnaC03g27150D [Brassica napus]